MAKFPGMTVNGKFCSTAREAARRAGVSTQAIYTRAQRGWVDGQPHGGGGREPTVTNFRYRDTVWPDVRTASETEGVSRQAVYDHLRRTGQIGGADV